MKIYEQLTLTYVNFEGVVTELSILIEDFMPFNYDLTDWYDNRTIDNYLYLKTKVKRVNETTPYTIGLITSYFPNETFANYSAGYSLANIDWSRSHSSVSRTAKRLGYARCALGRRLVRREEQHDAYMDETKSLRR
ncbi:MAG: hypothetical protein MZU97_24115 [Bacillus subtilis]|nr:hypothetical protein [Bacillus subtilis]